MVRRGVTWVLVALTLGVVPAASAKPHERRMTAVQRYTLANDGVVIASAFGGVNPVAFLPPRWAQSAYVTVRDETPGPQEAVFFSVSWGPDSSIHCSHDANDTPSDSTLRAAYVRARPGTLFVQPLVGQPLFEQCAVPYLSLPTSGTIKVTFSSKRLLTSGSSKRVASPVSARPETTFGRPVTVIPHCNRSTDPRFSSIDNCYEPSVAVDPTGRIFVTYGLGDVIAVSRDNGAHFVRLAGPPPPPGSSGAFSDGDAIVQIDASGRLVLSRLLSTGVQVAVSSDGARTWRSNVLIGSSGVTTSPLPDRQWLGFAHPDTVFALWRTNGFVYWTATSTDGGRTFAPPQPFLPGEVIASTGPPLVDRGGRVYVPVILGAGISVPQTIAVAVSPKDVGPGSFTLRTITSDYAVEFPIAVLDGAGHLEVSWNGFVTNTTGPAPIRVVRVSASSDRGRTWSSAVVWGTGAATVSPWVGLRSGRVDVLWYAVRDSGRTSRLMLTRGRTNGSERRQAVVAGSVTACPPCNEGNTDYANFAYLRDGRIVAVWGNPAVFVATELRRTAARR